MADSTNGAPHAREAEDFEAKGLDSPRGPNPLNLLQIAIRRMPLLIFGLVVGAVLGVLYYARCSPLYESHAQLLVVKKRPDALPTTGGQESIDSQSDDYLSTQVGIIKSPLMVTRALKDKDLASLRSKESGEAALRSIVATRDPKDPRNNILYLTSRASDPEDSQLVLQAITNAYKQFMDETYKSISDETVKLITRARDILGNDLTKQEAAYREFRLKSPVLLLRGRNGTSLNQEQLLTLQAKLFATQLRRDELQRRLEEMEKAVKEGRSQEEWLAMVSELGNVSTTMDDSGRKGGGNTSGISSLVEEKILLEDYGQNHPKVQALRKRADFARAFLLDSLRRELSDVKLSASTVEGIIKDTLADSRRTMNYEIEDDSFRSGIARTQQLYEAVLRRLQEVDIVRDFGGYTTQIIGPPTVGNKIAPKETAIFSVAVCLGLLGGLGLAVLADLTDKTFRSAEEIRRRLDLPVLAHVPSIPTKGNGKEQAVPGDGAIAPVVCCHHRPNSRTTEMYRGVRTALYFSARAGGHRVIQVTSPTAGDGKTTLAVNLAVCIAQSGKKVLLLDADLRRPSVHTVLGLSNERGLASLILAECKPEDLIQQPAGLPGLAVLTSGGSPSPAELLTSLRFQQVLESLREQYDFVIVDSPPLLAVTDPCVIAPHVDGVLLTLRIVKNGRPLAERARDMLSALGTKVLGVVVNGVREHRQGYEGYGYEGYAYSKRDYSRHGHRKGRSNYYYEEETKEGSGAVNGQER